MVNDKADKVNEKRFESLLNIYQIGLETSMRGSDFIFDCVYLLYHKYHKMNFKQRGPYIDSPDWIKIRKATINHIHKKDNECFQYTVIVVLNYEQTKK